MTDRELLLYIYGYLNGVLNTTEIQSHRILEIKDIIIRQQKRNKAKLQILASNKEIDDIITLEILYEEDECLKKMEELNSHDFLNYNSKNNNDKYYNETLDLDQQDPDFYS